MAPAQRGPKPRLCTTTPKLIPMTMKLEITGRQAVRAFLKTFLFIFCLSHQNWK